MRPKRAETYEPLVDRAVSLLAPVTDGYSVALAVERKLMIKLARSQPSVVQGWEEATLGLYLLKDGRTLVLSLSNPSLEGLSRAIEEGLSIIRGMAPSEYYAEPPSPRGYAPLSEAFDQRTAEALEDPSRLVEVIGALLGRGVELAGMVSVGMRSLRLRTSSGFEGDHETTFLNGYFRAFIEERSGQWAFSSTKLDEGALAGSIERAIELASLQLPFVRLEEGAYKVILSPLVVGNLFNLVARMTSAFAIDNGFSFFRYEDVGREVASSQITLVDAPRNAAMPLNSPFDLEGVPTFDKPLVEKGVLRTVLHNSATAKKRGAISTGNAGWVDPTPWNLVLGQGDSDLEEMMAEMGRGLLVTNVWYTRFQNITTGEFSTVARDAVVYVEGGEPRGLVRKARLSSSLPQVLSRTLLVGRERFAVQWWEVELPTAAPHMLVEEMRVTLPGAP